MSLRRSDGGCSARTVIRRLEPLDIRPSIGYLCMVSPPGCTWQKVVRAFQDYSWGRQELIELVALKCLVELLQASATDWEDLDNGNPEVRPLGFYDAVAEECSVGNSTLRSQTGKMKVLRKELRSARSVQLRPDEDLVRTVEAISGADEHMLVC